MVTMRLIVNFVIMVIVLACTAVAATRGETLIESVRYEPLGFSTATGVTVEPITKNANELTFEYRWLLNGEEMPWEDSAHFPGEQLVRGDTVAVEITAIDEFGNVYPPFVTLPITVANAPPFSAKPPTCQLEAGELIGQVFAEDPDGDPIHFELLHAPDGFALDQDSGKFTWTIPQSVDGVYSIQMAIDDGEGGRVENTFEVQWSKRQQKDVDHE